MTGTHICLQRLAEFIAIHSRHHDIADNDGWYQIEGLGQPFPPIGSLIHRETIRERVGDVLTDTCIILNNQNGFIGFDRLVTLLIGVSRAVAVRLILQHNSRFYTMNGRRINIVFVECYGKGTPFLHTTLHTNSTLMQGNEFFDERQTDTRTRSLMFTIFLIESFKDMGQSTFCYTIPRIGYDDIDKMLITLTTTRDTRYNRATFRIF